MLKIQLKTPVGMLSALAELVGGDIENGILKIPEDKGKGYIRGFMLDSTIGMMLRDYELNDDLLLRRQINPNANERIVMQFNNVFRSKYGVESTSSDALSTIKNLPSVQIGKGKIDFETIFPSKTKFRSLMLAIDAVNLQALLGPNEDNAIFKNIITSDQPLLFEELVSPAIQKVVLDIIDAAVPQTLQNFYFRIKAEELICLLFAELLKREKAPVHALNENDVQKVYQIRDFVLSALDTPPVLSDLAAKAGMSESKLKRLFKQIFGNSIFNYYQSFRMKEAAVLLKEKKLSVSEVGFQMGFSNLSHFSKIFEEHIGMKPKKYSVVG
jgi:AraC-like DNA-binding protein